MNTGVSVELRNDSSQGYLEMSASSDLLSLPFDIQNVLFSYLSPRDVVNLSSVCKRYRIGLASFAFKRVKGTWNDINDDKLFSTKFSDIIEHLRIINHSSYGEWQLDFDQILRALPNLIHLKINSSNSSNWLKYRGNTRLTHMTLYLDEESVTQWCHLRYKSPRIFALSHVNNFGALQKLSLSNYHFNWDNGTDPAVALRELSLHDCTWEYPFQISQFDVHESLVDLKIIFHKNNSFILSERFNHLITGDKESFKSLINLSIELLPCGDSEYDLQKFLSLSNFLKFMNLSHFPKLDSLKLHGYSLNLENLMYIIRTIDEEANKLDVLNLKIVCHSNDLLQVEIYKFCSQKFPQMKLILDTVLTYHH